MHISVRKNSAQPRKAEEIGETILGPIVDRWMLALHQYVSFLDDGDTEFLFCARAGARIKKLYDLHIGQATNSEPIGKLFWSSRVSACKGVFNRFPKGATEILTSEFRHDSLKLMISSLLRNNPDYGDLINYSDRDFSEKGEVFSRWVQSNKEHASIVLKYLSRCGEAFDDYLGELKDGKNKIVLIDSGWQGTAQWLLSNAYPSIDFKGLYFGRIISRSRDVDFIDRVIGLMFESEKYVQEHPITAVVHFRHLIEKLLEGGGPSIEEVPAGQFRAIAEKQIGANEAASWNDEDDPLFRGVMTYLKERTKARNSISEIVAAYDDALPKLERLVLFPTAQEAMALGDGGRSVDFGKSLVAPILRKPHRYDEEDQEERIQRSLWPPGQIAIELDTFEAEARQAQFSGLGARSFAENVPQRGADEITDRSVAVITRTKNRPVLLSRAAESVAGQTHKNYTWIVVNDGGDEEKVRAVLESCPVERHRIILINNKFSRGMEAASNLGIRNSGSRFIAIHDDDDSWSPDFLDKTTEYLVGIRGRTYGGVVCKSVYISEEIRANRVIEHSRSPYHDWVRNIHLAEMARQNFFPPIAFLFRRSMYEEIGGYNEELPVLGDWFFNMEFLLKADIGVIRNTTAYYHHRDIGALGGAYSNSVIGDVTRHEEYASVARNMFLRKYGSNNAAAVAVINGYFAQETKILEQKLDGYRGATDSTSGESVNIFSSRSDQEELDRIWLINQLNSDFVFSLVADLEQYKHKMVRVDTSLEDLISTIISRQINVAPPPSFNENAYINRYTDVADAMSNGSIPNGYIHYLAFGHAEGRRRFRNTSESQERRA